MDLSLDAFLEVAGSAGSMLAELMYQLLLPVALLLFAISLWDYYINSLRDKNVDLPLPPGTVGLPFVGETISMVIQGWKFYKTRKEKYGHIYKTHVLGKPTIRVWGTKNIQKVLKNEELLLTMSWPTSAVKIIGSGSLMASTRRTHDKRRAWIAKAFTNKAVNNYSVQMEKILNRWVTKRCDECNVIKTLQETKNLAFELSSVVLLGTECSQDEMTRLMHGMNIMIANFFTLHVDLPGTGFHQAMVARKEVISIMNGIIEKKQRLLSADHGESDDVLSILLQFLERGEITQNEILDSLIEGFFSSINGIPSLCCSTLFHLGKNPGVISRVLEELDDYGLMENGSSLTMETLQRLPYLEQVWKEITRIAPPFGGGFREVLKTFELEGYQIPVGWTVLYSIRDNHEAEENFHSFADFNPDRWLGVKSNDSWLPFGGNGIRSCVGQRYTTTFLRQFIAVIVKHSQWEIHETNPGFKQFPILLPDAQLPMVFHHRKISELS